MKDAQILLDMVTRQYPPLKGHAHQLVLLPNKQLQLNLVHVAPCWKILFSQDDLKKTPVQLLEQIIVLMKQKDEPTPAA